MRVSERRTIRTALFCAAVAFIAAVGLLAMSADEAAANGAPIKVILTYLKGVSNYGPTSATGVAEIVMKEGEVSVSVVGLPALNDESYAGWLVNSTSGEAISVGRFNADASGVVKARLVLQAEIPDKHWNLFLITAEARAGTLLAPGERHSIGGYFPDAAEASRTPAQLPNTGGDTGQTSAGARPAGQPGSQPAPATPAPSAGRGISDSDRNILTVGVVALAIIGLGVYTRARRSR